MAPLDAAIAALVAARHRDPFAVLGPHDDNGATVVRAFQPAARAIELRLVSTGQLLPMTERDPAGLFEVRVAAAHGVFPDYRLRIAHPGNHVVEIDDPYRYGRVLTDFDRICGEGRTRPLRKVGGDASPWHENGGNSRLGANADSVSLIGDFNGWGAGSIRCGGWCRGVWEIFIPDLGDGGSTIEIGRAPERSQETDPFAFEAPPQSAAVVHDVSGYEWGDAEWIAARAAEDAWLDRPMSTYEVHLGSWARVPEEGNRFLTYRELAHRLVPYVKALGFTHLELLP